MACPILSMLVLLRVIVPTITSTTLPNSSASKPNARNVSVAISVARDRSISPIRARLRTPPNALIDSAASKPAIPKKRRALADSVAVQTVVSPAFLAASANISNSAVVARTTPPTIAIWCSKSAPAFNASITACTALRIAI